MTTPNVPFLCPCTSMQPYATCCQPYHEGKALPKNALLLMRSRYAAYALALSDYLIQTTHPNHPNFTKFRQQWKEEILRFSKTHDFPLLEILAFQDGEGEAWVTFVANLNYKGKDQTFTEKSHFLKVDGKWLYLDGVVAKGRVENLAN